MKSRILLALCSSLLVAPAFAASTNPLDQDALDRLLLASSESAQVTYSRATGAARIVVVDPASPIGAQPGTTAEARALAFLSEYAGLFGLDAPADDLDLVATTTDRVTGGERLQFEQRHRGVEVFGTRLYVHFDPSERLRVVNGDVVPHVSVDTTPTLSAEEAVAAARQHVAKKGHAAQSLATTTPELRIYRDGLLKGIPGDDHLVYLLNVGDRETVWEAVFVDAHRGHVVNAFSELHTDLFRRAYDSEANYPSTPYWNEGDAFPTAEPEANAVILGSGFAYDFFFNGFGFDSWDGAGAEMHAVFNRTTSCPNASWNGLNTSYCPGVVGDDTVAHEWAHAYTDGTHDLIYQWQSGALNESYSDIWGEAVDNTNGYGTDSPDLHRLEGECSVFGGSPVPGLTINSPGNIAGDYDVSGAEFNPTGPVSVTAAVERIDDGTGANPNDGCEAFTITAGNIALIDRGNCNFVDKVANAETAGASGVLMINDRPDPPINMGGTGNFTIPSVLAFDTDGADILGELPTPGVNATIELSASVDPSVRWIASEDDPGFGGAIRDMWNPTCFGNPGKVSDTLQYHCDGDVDNGGVHLNSGVPNHGFALLHDGGTYNGIEVTGLGLMKAGHIYWRAQSVYQTPVTNFDAHADALEMACSDLIGVPLSPLGTLFADGFESGDTLGWTNTVGFAGGAAIAGTPSNEITAADCTEVSDMIAAVEFRMEVPCDFELLLDPDPPAMPICTGTSVDSSDFEGSLDGWTASRRAVANPGTFDDRDWSVVATLPDSRPGSAAFAPDPIVGDCGADTEAGVLVLSKDLGTLPAGDHAEIEFDHWVATELGWDGGNVKISVNGGAAIVIPGTAFRHNPYNDTMEPTPNDNPMQGEEGFTGANEGSTGDGSWGTSVIDLTGIADPGDSVTLLFELGTDGCNGSVGWYVDDIDVVVCP